MEDCVAFVLLPAGVSIGRGPVVSDDDLVMTRQSRGETRRDLSVEGNPLSIAGKAYSSGIGSHATSMIPVSVPESAPGGNRRADRLDADGKLGNR